MSTLRYCDIADPEEYVLMRVIMELSTKFKVGDYVRMNTFEYEYEGDMDVVKITPHLRKLATVNSKYSYCTYDKNIYGDSLFKITSVSPGYVEAVSFSYNLKESKMQETTNADHLFSFLDTRNSIDDLVGYMDYTDEIEPFIQKVIDNYLKIDEEYVESLLLDAPYIPGRDIATHVASEIKKAKKVIHEEERHLRSKFAVIGWQTRKRNIIIKARKEKAEAKKAKKK